MLKFKWALSLKFACSKFTVAWGSLTLWKFEAKKKISSGWNKKKFKSHKKVLYEKFQLSVLTVNAQNFSWFKDPQAKYKNFLVKEIIYYWDKKASF